MQPAAGSAGMPNVRKEFVVLGGRTLLERVVSAVAAETSEVIVVAAPGEALPELPDGVRIVRDSSPGAGPLAGIADGLRAAAPGAELAVIASCDVPLLRREMVRLLVALAAASRAEWTVPEVGGHRQVLLSAVRLSALPPIDAWLAGGRRDPRGLVEQMERAIGAVRIVTETECRAADPTLESFLDVDSPEDLDRVLRQLAYGKPGGGSYTAAP
jgi:molybdopterin-guanine dinucleotide biosynthesis protein A